MLQLAWSGGGVSLFAGIPAHLTFQIVSVFRDDLHAIFMAWLQRTHLFTDRSSRRAKNGVWLRAADKACPSSLHPFPIIAATVDGY